MTNPKPWTYSHTQTALWNLCKRRYFFRYVANLPEPPPNEAMVYSSLLVHGALEAKLRYNVDATDYWPDAWAEYTTTFPNTKLSLEPAQAAFNAYTSSPLEGEVELVETKTYVTVGGYSYVSKPDLVLRRGRSRWTVDYKFSLSDWGPKPLSPFDDQLLGQAITHDADGFIRVHLRWGKIAKWGSKKGLEMTVEEQPVDPVLAEEWREETKTACHDIEDTRELGEVHKDNSGWWPKSTGSCYAFGRPCEYMAQCKLGLKLALTMGANGGNVVDDMEVKA